MVAERVYPDILLVEHGIPIAAAEIKTFFTDGKTTLKKAFRRLEKLRGASNKQFKGAIIVYNNGPTTCINHCGMP
jgi:hypothetical protein